MQQQLKLSALFIAAALSASSQNDIDAIRYSRNGVNGTSRFQSMGGAFGAVGGDVSCAAYNPAGLAIFRRGEISFSGSLKFMSDDATLYNKTSNKVDAKGAFNNFGLAYAWNSNNDADSRHAIAFTNTQLQNFSSSIQMSGYSNSSSVGKDMLNLANQYAGAANAGVGLLNPSYEGLGFQSYLLDTVNNGFISLEDTKRSVLQSRTIATTGRVNDLNFSYAYSYKDQFYFGASLGIPRVEYSTTTTHNEIDDRDSMRIGFTSSNTYTSTYVDGLPQLNSYDSLLLGFNSLQYVDYYKTQGSGINLKLGGIVRVNEVLRLGAYYHTPTVYNLTDTYYSSISTSYDRAPGKTYDIQYPQDGGYFEYKIITPARLGLNSAFIINKIAVVSLDYEMVNYNKARISSSSADFTDVNNIIRNSYKTGHNIRLGGELNIKPVMLRLGYAMQGSPYGDVFSGNFVQNTVSGGIGFRGKSRWYLDIVVSRTFSSEIYYLFSTLNTTARIKYNTTNIGATVGIKF